MIPKSSSVIAQSSLLHSVFLLFLLLLAHSALTCQNGSAILDGGLGLSAEQLIDASQEDYVMDIGIPASPGESREVWEAEGSVNFTKRETAVQSADTPQAARSSVQTAAVPEEGKDISSRRNLASSKTPAINEVNTSVTGDQSGLQQPTVIAGNWTFRLRGSKTAVMGLTVYQTNAVVFGSGSLNDGGDSLPVQASGLIQGSNITLDVVTSRDVRLYKLDLWEKSPSIPKSLSGSFQAFSAGGEYWAGTAEAEKRG